MTAPHDDVDRRLREYAWRWQQSVPVPSPGPLPARQPARRHRRWAVTAAAVTAAVLVAAIVLAAQLLDTDRRSATPAVQPGHVIPWAPLPATHPEIRSWQARPRPDPAAALAAPPCRADQLQVRRSVGPAAGTYYLTARLHLMRGTGCRLDGYPELSLLSGGRSGTIPLRHESDDSVYHHPVLVDRTHVATLLLAWGSEWCTTPVRNEAIVLRLPAGGGTVRFPGFGVSPACNVTGGSGKAPVFVWPFQPEHARPDEVRSRYSSIRATGDLTHTVTTGTVLHFVVALRSRQRVVLAPCPDYSILVVGRHLTEHRYALNCAAVPYRDTQGRPYLPADTPVRFQMQVRAAGASVQKLGWQLATPGDRPSVTGLLTVR